MKKRWLVVLLFAVMVMAASPVNADVFGVKCDPKFSQADDKDLLMNSIYSVVDINEETEESDTILGYASEIIEYLGVREGVFYDCRSGEYANYAAATLYTYKPWATSISVGVLGVDGYAVTIDYNLGRHVPCESVPLLSIFEYLYIGVGIGSMRFDGDETGDSHRAVVSGFDAQFKITW